MGQQQSTKQEKHVRKIKKNIAKLKRWAPEDPITVNWTMAPGSKVTSPKWPTIISSLPTATAVHQSQLTIRKLKI